MSRQEKGTVETSCVGLGGSSWMPCCRCVWTGGVLNLGRPLTEPGQHAEAGSNAHRHEARDGQDRMVRVG